MFVILLSAAALAVLLVLILKPRRSVVRVRKMVEEGRLEQARTALRALLLRQDRSPELHLLLSRVYEKELNFEHAVVEQKILLKNGVFSPRFSRESVIEAVSRNYLRLNKPAEGLHLLEEEMKRNPRSPAVRFWTGHMLSLTGRTAEAQSLLEKLVRDEPSHLPALAELGGLHVKAGRTGPAQEMLERVILSDRRNFAAYFHLASLYRDRKEWDKAVEHFENARHDKDLRPAAMLNLARCFRAKEMAKNAIEILERLASEWEADPYYSRVHPAAFIAEARYELAEVYLYDKDYQNALDQWQIIQTLVPDFRDVTAKIQANARFGRDRVQDFLIAPAGDFEKVCFSAMDQLKYAVESRRSEGGEKMFLTVRGSGGRGGKRFFVGFYRVQNPVGETVLADFERRMKDAGLSSGEVYSATGFTPTGVKFVLDRPIRIFGKGQVMKFLKSFENRFHKN